MRKGNFRSKKLLMSAKDVPSCMGCGADNVGNVVAAHANWSEYGKGMGLKAHDWAIAFLCESCHYGIDAGEMGRDEKKSSWAAAHAKTLEWLFETGRLKANG